MSHAIPSGINLKEKILETLRLHNYSYSQLAEYLGVSEEELDQKFADHSIEVRTLELISKALRIPLYSFFRDSDFAFNYDEEPYYNVNIWGKEGVELRTTLKKDKKGDIAADEIERLKNELREKEKQLRELKTKLKQ